MAMTCPKCQHPLSSAQRQRPFTSFTRTPVSCQHCAAPLQIRIQAPRRWWSAIPWVGLASLVLISILLDRIRVQAMADEPIDPARLWWFAVLIPLVTVISVGCAINNYRHTRLVVEVKEP